MPTACSLLSSRKEALQGSGFIRDLSISPFRAYCPRGLHQSDFVRKVPHAQRQDMYSEKQSLFLLHVHLIGYSRIRFSAAIDDILKDRVLLAFL